MKEWFKSVFIKYLLITIVIMDTYSDCVSQAKKISKKIHYLINGVEGNIESKFFIEFPDISNLHYKSSILILGLNPSASENETLTYLGIFLMLKG